MRTGCAWRHLPKRFPHWDNVYKTFRRWSVPRVVRRGAVMPTRRSRAAKRSLVVDTLGLLLAVSVQDRDAAHGDLFPVPARTDGFVVLAKR
jgi:hypothetical protein